jgi:uncharacterized protein (TIGR01777 family)
LRVCVSGGTGLIGRRLILALRQRQDDVVCLSRDAEAARTRLPLGVEIIEADPALAGDWQDALVACDAVVNLAGASVAEGYWTERRKRLLRRSRLDTTRNLADAIVRAGEGPQVLVSASATGYYGDGGARALDEACEPGHDFLARLAREWEGTALQAESSRTRVVLLRIGVVLAREGGAWPQLSRPFKFGLGGTLGGGQQYFPWIHIEDLVRVILFALDTADLRGPVNAVAPDPPTQRVLARALGNRLRRPRFWMIPGFLLRALLGEKAKMLLSSQRVVPKALRSKEFQFKYDILDEALKDLLASAD